MRPIYNLDGSRDFNVRTYNVSSQTIAKGALVKVALGTVTAVGADFGATAGNFALGVTAKAVVSTDTTCQVVLIGPNTVLESEILEIRDATAITATTTSKTAIVDSSVDGAADDELIGAVLEVTQIADTTIPVGTQVTLTDYATGSGTLTHANAVFNAATTGSASGDKFKFVKISSNLIGSRNLNVPAASDCIALDAASATVATEAFRVIGISDDNKKVHLVCTKTAAQF